MRGRKGAEKDKPLVGLVIIRDLARAGNRYRGGTMLDPEDGKVYRAELWVEDGRLRVHAYWGFLSRIPTWIKRD